MTKKISNLLSLRIDGHTGVLFILFWSIIMEGLIEYIHLPGEIRYINDLVLVSVVFKLQHTLIDRVKENYGYWLWISVVVLFVFDICTAIVNLVSPLLVIWAIRNTFRGIVYMFCVIATVHANEVNHLFRVMLYLQIPNLLLATFQFLVTSHGDQDLVHGLFANGAGSNTFSAMLLAYYLNLYLNKKGSLIPLGFVLTSSVVIATMAEEKTFFAYLIVILLVSILISRRSFKTFFFICFATIASFLLYNFIMNIRPDLLTFFSDPNASTEYLTATWSGSYGIPRIGAFKYISQIFFQNNPIVELVGFGFGSGEHAQFSFLDSPFFIKYGTLMYRNFTHQWTFIETGYVGFILLIGIFVSAFFCLIRRRSLYKVNNNVLNITAMCMCFVCILSMWSNATLKLDAAYIPYFGVAIGFLSLERIR